jgi:hypothetical protein
MGIEQIFQLEEVVYLTSITPQNNLPMAAWTTLVIRSLTSTKVMRQHTKK